MKEPFVVVTVISTRGYAPQDPGAKAIVTASGLYFGTVGGGKIEARAIQEAKAMLSEQAKAPVLFTWNLQRDVGMSCGGEMQILLEPYGMKAWPIVIFGAGHISQALCPVLMKLSCQLFCIDTREEWLAKLPAESLHFKKILLEDYTKALLDPLLDRLPAGASFVITTRGHATDLAVLERVAERETPPYVGVIGSRIKGPKLRNDLLKAGVSAAFVEKLYCPMGLMIGNSNDPQEIAISIAAQLIQERGSGNRDPGAKKS